MRDNAREEKLILMIAEGWRRTYSRINMFMLYGIWLSCDKAFS